MLVNSRILHSAQRAIPLLVLVALSLLVVIPSAQVAAEDKRDEADRVISIVAERFSFVPSVIRLEQGEVVELRIRSLDTNHGFRIREAGVNVIVPKRGRGDARILFRAQKKGTFPFDCSKACGAGHTIMRGRIVVK
jgi:heme/copper-type cytochrome/quinol oxidase subunit 2